MPPSIAPNPRKNKRFKRILLLLLFGLVVGLGLAEVGLRVINAALHGNIYELDATLGWKHTPGVDRLLQDEDGRSIRFLTDEQGLRIDPGDVRTQAQPQSDSQIRRVLFVGDSFTQASEVEAEETFSALLAARLDAVVASNAGVGGYSTVQELLALPAWLASLQPQLVVLVLYENDFVDNLMPYFAGLGPKPYMRIVDDQPELVTKLDIASFEPFLQPAPGAFWLYQHCALYRAVHKNLFLPRHAQQLELREQVERAAISQEQGYLVMRHLLDRFAKQSNAAGCELVIAAIPKRQEAHDGTAESHPWLAAQCQELDVTFVSLLEPLHRAGATTSYFATDIHLRRAGHQCIAEALAPVLTAALAR